jgi:hypothetical protein
VAPLLVTSPAAADSPPDWADTVVRMVPGTRAPSTATDGVQVYVGRGGTTSVEALKPGPSYAFAAFSRDADGHLGVPATRTMPAVTVSLRIDPARRGYRGEGGGYAIVVHPA